MRVVQPRAARRRAGVAGDLGRAGRTDVHDDDPLVFSDAVGADPDLLAQQGPGTEYCPPSKATIGVFAATVRVTPNATVCGTAGSGCSRACSSASISTGARRVTRCTRPLTCPQNTSHAASRSANEAYSPSRFASFGTRSALASFTVDSEPPLLAGSAGSQV